MMYNYGVQLSYWYEADLAVHICLRAVLGIEAKKKIHTGHTFLEIVKLKYGKSDNILYMFLCFINNLLLCSSMILGAAGAIYIACDNFKYDCKYSAYSFWSLNFIQQSEVWSQIFWLIMFTLLF